jgi:hypothetical protein
MIGSTQGAGAFIVLCSAVRGQQADVTSIRLLSEKLHAAYSARDLDTIDALWSDRSQQKTTQREATQGLLTNTAISGIYETTDPEVAEGRAPARGS